MAEPEVDLIELGPKFIEQHKIDVVPLAEDDHHEKLWAYHARNELLNSIIHSEQHDFDWQVANIERHLHKEIPDKTNEEFTTKSHCLVEEVNGWTRIILDFMIPTSSSDMFQT